MSVILPAYNRASFLAIAISSVISQSVDEWELIIADDGSGEEARACLRGITHPAVHVIELAHCGNPAEVRNVALAAATGRYVAFLDSDDVWKPRKLELQLAALRAQPKARWSFTGTDRIDSSGLTIDDPPGTRVSGSRRLGFCRVASPRNRCRDADRDGRTQSIDRRGRLRHGAGLRRISRSLFALGAREPGRRVAEALTSVRVHDAHYSADRVAALGSWMMLYERYARLAPDAALRAHSAKMRALTAARLAARYVARPAACGPCRLAKLVAVLVALSALVGRRAANPRQRRGAGRAATAMS